MLLLPPDPLPPLLHLVCHFVDREASNALPGCTFKRMQKKKKKMMMSSLAFSCFFFFFCILLKVQPRSALDASQAYAVCCVSWDVHLLPCASPSLDPQQAMSVCGYTQGEMAALFLRHEGFLGAMGAFLKVHPMTSSSFHTSSTKEPRKVRH